MHLLNDLQRIASADQSTRRSELLALLREMDCPFIHFREHLAGYRPENIVVRFHEGAPARFVIGAHYDSVPGSTGANDNGAGVCVLLAWLRQALYHPPTVPLDVVFFDLEEVGCIGSRVYVDRFSPEGMLAMINLDICGVGDTILVAPGINVQQSPLSQALLKVEQSGLCSYRVVDALPPGDDLSFEDVGVPNLSVCILPSEDVEPLIETIEFMRQGRAPVTSPRIIETMHNNSRDSFETIEESAMQKVLNWLEAVLKQL